MEQELVKIKIAFVINSLRIGGAAKMVRFVANAVSDSFKEVHLISLFGTEKSGLNSNVICHNLNIDLSGNKLLRRFITINKIRGCIKEIEPDIICAFVSDVAYLTRIATLGFDVIMTTAERGDPNSEPWWAKPIIKWAYKKSDYCFFQLQQARDYFGESLKKKSFIIPNPFVPDKSVQPFKGERNKTIVSAGRFTWQKGFDTLIRAFKLVYDKHPNYTLVIYGEGPLESEYRSLTEKLGIQDIVSFPGYVKNVAQSIREDGIFVLSSRYEGIPNALIEAMSVKLPVVTTDCAPGGGNFLTNKGERGLLVPIDDVEKMSDAINQIIDNEKLQKMLSEKGSEILEELDVERITSMWINAFKEIINNRYE